MTIQTNRRNSGEKKQNTICVAQIENQFNDLIGQLDDLREVSSSAAAESEQALRALDEKLRTARKELEELSEEVKGKETRESLHLTQIYESTRQEQLEQLIKQHITFPESVVKLFWDHLRLRVEAAPNGGVAVTMGFLASSRLPDLRFNIKFTDRYKVEDCDPLIIGLSELADQLNADNQSGALARFICRLRARYTAQYMNEFN